jgi:hypothetical protein
MATGHSPNGENQGCDLVEPSKALQSVRPAADLEKHRSVDAGYYRLARAQRQFICWQIS